RRIAFGTRRAELAHSDIATLLEKPLGGKPTIIGPTIVSPHDLARRLVARDPSRVDLVAIYDDDPSPFLQEFLDEYNRIRPPSDAARLKPLPLPTADRNFTIDRLRVTDGGLAYAVVPYKNLVFYDVKDLLVDERSDVLLAVAAVPASGDATMAAPVILTNL